MKKDPVTLALGDIRWDSLPTSTSLGGAAAVFAARFATLGRKARCVGVVGGDKHGTVALEGLLSSAVDTALIQKHPALPTETGTFVVASDGSVTLSSHERGCAAFLEASPALMAVADEVELLFWSSASQRDQVTGETFRRFLEVSPPNFKVYDIDCSVVMPTREELEAGLAVASVVHLRGKELGVVCEVLGLPDLEPGLLAPAITERFGVSYCVIADPLAGALVSSIVGEQVGMDISRDKVVDLLGWHEAFLAGFTHHVFMGSTLARCCGAGVQYGEAVALTHGALAPLNELDILAVKY